jgi:hypothetical protein
VLFDEDALGEGVGVVSFADGDGALEDDSSVVEVFVDEMDGTAGDLDPVIEGLLLSVESGKCRKQRRMDVENAVGKGRDELRREEAHVAGKTHEVDVVLAEGGNEVGVVLGAGASSGDEDRGGKVEVAGGQDAGGVSNVGYDDGNFDVGKAALTDGASDGEEVGAATGEEDS